MQICVLYWCRGYAFTASGELKQGEYQLKIRAIVNNYSDSPLDISIDKPSRIRLLVSGGGIDKRWHPRNPTLHYGDRPVLVRDEGRNYWAIAPNRPGSEVKGPRFWTGFLTTWVGPRLLPPHQNYGVINRDPHRGNLVFQVPLDPVNGDYRAAIHGLAILDYQHGKPSILAIDYAADWGSSQEPTSF